jgi:hypothetical protein
MCVKNARHTVSMLLRRLQPVPSWEMVAAGGPQPPQEQISRDGGKHFAPGLTQNLIFSAENQVLSGQIIWRFFEVGGNLAL